MKSSVRRKKKKEQHLKEKYLHALAPAFTGGTS